jgi:hypothetical protein
MQLQTDPGRQEANSDDSSTSTDGGIQASLSKRLHHASLIPKLFSKRNKKETLRK